MKREHSSVGSERLPYKQRVGGSTPSAPTKKRFRKLSRFFRTTLPRTPGPLLPGGISRASQDGVFIENGGRRYPMASDAIGMPLGAVAKRLEVEGKTKITCHGNMPYTLLRGSLVWQVRSKSPHLPALYPAESNRRQVRMAGDFQVRLAGGAVGLCGMRSRNRHRTPRKRRRRASSVTAIMMVQPSNPA